jgi:hypothetical protein
VKSGEKRRGKREGKEKVKIKERKRNLCKDRK